MDVHIIIIIVIVCDCFVAKIAERQKEVESFLSAEDGAGSKDIQMEENSNQYEEGGEGEMHLEENGRGRREGLESGDADSNKE